MLSTSSSLLRCSPTGRRLGSFNRDRAGSQVLGTAVPSFAAFPYKYRDTLYLYREFLRLIHHYHAPEERHDLLFRLRNEFQGKRHLTGRKVISAAVRRGEGVLALQRQLLERNEDRRLRASLPSSYAARERTPRQGSAAQLPVAAADGGADNVDALWGQLQSVSNSMVPGLRNSRSLDIAGASYAAQATSKNVWSRRR